MSRWLCVGYMAGLLTVSCVLAQSPAPADPAAKSGAKAGADLAGSTASSNCVEDCAGEWRGQDVHVYQRDAWVLEITYLNPDTRSEGQQGRLLKDGKPVDTVEKGGSLVTPLGLLKYYGSERKNLWDVTGWNFADRRRIRRSADLPRPVEKKPGVVADPAPSGQP